MKNHNKCEEIHEKSSNNNAIVENVMKHLRIIRSLLQFTLSKQKNKVVNFDRRKHEYEEKIYRQRINAEERL